MRAGRGVGQARHEIPNPSMFEKKIIFKRIKCVEH
jgi:hypothetical protein